jgi:hypothetical protein
MHQQQLQRGEQRSLAKQGHQKGEKIQGKIQTDV